MFLLGFLNDDQPQQAGPGVDAGGQREVEPFELVLVREEGPVVGADRQRIVVQLKEPAGLRHCDSPLGVLVFKLLGHCSKLLATARNCSKLHETARNCRCRLKLKG